MVRTSGSGYLNKDRSLFRSSFINVQQALRSLGDRVRNRPFGTTDFERDIDVA